MTPDTHKTNPEPPRFSLNGKPRSGDPLAAGIARGASQYVILGTAPDTFAPLAPNADARVFEVGHPAAQAAESGSPSSVVFVPADFEERSLASALAEAGFQAAQVSFFSWLGASPWKSPQATLAALQFIASLPSGSGVLFDYAPARSTLDPPQETAMDALASRLPEEDDSTRVLLDSSVLERVLRFAGFHEIEDAPHGPAHLVTARV